MFGSTQASKPLFGASTTTTAPQAGGLFGTAGAATQSQTGGLFGSTTATSQPQSGGLFGTTATTSQPQTGGLFGSTTAASQAPTGDSSAPQQQPHSLKLAAYLGPRQLRRSHRREDSLARRLRRPNRKREGYSDLLQLHRNPLLGTAFLDPHSRVVGCLAVQTLPNKPNRRINRLHPYCKVPS